MKDLLLLDAITTKAYFKVIMRLSEYDECRPNELLKDLVFVTN